MIVTQSQTITVTWDSGITQPMERTLSPSNGLNSMIAE